MHLCKRQHTAIRNNALNIEMQCYRTHNNHNNNNRCSVEMKWLWARVRKGKEKYKSIDGALENMLMCFFLYLVAFAIQILLSDSQLQNALVCMIRFFFSLVIFVLFTVIITVFSLLLLNDTINIVPCKRIEFTSSNWAEYSM